MSKYYNSLKLPIPKMGFEPCYEFYFRSKVQHTLLVWEVLVSKISCSNCRKEFMVYEKNNFNRRKKVL